MPDETKITGKACEQDDRGDGKDGGKGVKGMEKNLNKGRRNITMAGRTNKKGKMGDRVTQHSANRSCKASMSK